MHRVNLPAFLTLLLILGATADLCAQVTFTVRPSQKTVGVKDVLELEFVINGASQVDQFIPPSFSPFQVVQGPSYTSGFNLINGNASRSYTVSYYLQPPASVGKYTIGAGTAILGGQTMHSAPVTIEVVKNSTASSAPAPQNPFQAFAGALPADPFPREEPYYGDQYLRRNDDAQERIKRNLFLKMSVNKTTCYVGEPIIATCKLYTRLESQSRVEARPSFSGFSVFEMVPPEQQVNPVEETYDGRPFASFLLRKSQLYPLQSGDLSIEPVEVQNNVTFYREGKSDRQQAPAGSLIDQMMQDFWGEGGVAQGVPEKHQATLATPPIVIHVKPLPDAGKPANFQGAVGDFTIQGTLAQTVVRAGDPDTLTVAISGAGNLPMINAPEIAWPKGIDAFDPSAKEQLDQTVSPISGKKTFQFVFTVDKAGTCSVPAVSFSYFDPSKVAYKTLQTESSLLKVLPSLHPQASTQPGSNPLRPTPWNWLLLAIGLAAGVLGSVVVSRSLARRKEMRDLDRSGGAAPEPQPAAPAPEEVRYMHPDQQALFSLPDGAITTFAEKDWLEEPRNCLKGQDGAAFYQSLNRGLWGFLQERLRLERGERNKDSVLERLEEEGFSSQVREEVRELLEECELALYTPVRNPSDMHRCLDAAERLKKRFLHHLTD